MTDKPDIPQIPNDSDPPMVVEWWRKPLYYFFKLLPLVVLLVLVWNFITVTAEKQRERQAAPISAAPPAPDTTHTVPLPPQEP